MNLITKRIFYAFMNKHLSEPTLQGNANLSFSIFLGFSQTCLTHTEEKLSASINMKL